MSSYKKEEYKKREKTLKRRKQTKNNNNVKRWDSFKESVEKLINDQNITRLTIKNLHFQIKN